ncbi:hypothetical protein V2G26_001339 [Clonostachys chloroleuca]
MMANQSTNKQRICLLKKHEVRVMSPANRSKLYFTAMTNELREMGEMIKGLGQEDLSEVETMKTDKYKKEDAFSNHPIKHLAATLDDYSRIDKGATGGNVR